MLTTIEEGCCLRDDALLADLARRFATPLFVYDGDRITRRFCELRAAFDDYPGGVRFHYALKANTNLAIVKLLMDAGAHPECISGGEVELAKRVGARGSDVLLTSSSKSPRELEQACHDDILINVDSLDELGQLEKTAANIGRPVRVSFRVNPDVDPQTHRHIATGHKLTKFGLLLEDAHYLEGFRQAQQSKWLRPVGIQAHIGSQIMTLEPFERNAKLLCAAFLELEQELGLTLEFIDLGGGIGIRYLPESVELEPERIAAVVCDVVTSTLSREHLPELWFEPGRYFVGGSGVLLATVHSVKHTPFRNFINVDTGFNQFLRPLLYEAHHHARIVGRAAGATLRYDIAGNICETGDILAENRLLPTPQAGDLLVLEGAGAYGYALASEYNSFPLPAEVLVRAEGRVDLIRRRGTIDDLLRAQQWPSDLGLPPNGVGAAGDPVDSIDPVDPVDTADPVLQGDQS